MPLTGKINFEAALEKGNRVQFSKLIREHFKIERHQVLKVGVFAQGVWTAGDFSIQKWINKDA